MSNPRNRNQVQGLAAATQRVRLPGLGKPATGNPALDAWIAGVNERFEVREGTRGNPFERAVTVRDMQELGLLTPGPAPKVDFERVKTTSAYRSLLDRLDGIENLKDLPAQVRAILKKDILEEAKKRGADIRSIEDRLQTASESLAYTVRELTASIGSSAAGVRRVEFASATATSAVAGILETVSTTVDGHTATIAVQTISINGLEAQYTVKINVDGFISGFGLASTPVDGVPFSEFSVQADKFSIQTLGYTGQYPFVIQNVNGVPQLSVASAMIADAAIGTAQIAQHINSDTFDGTFDGGGDIATFGTDGWAIDKSGQAVFNNVKVRGDIEATSVNGTIVDTANILSNAVSESQSAEGDTSSSGASISFTVANTNTSILIIANGGHSYSAASGEAQPATAYTNPVSIIIDSSTVATGYGTIMYVLNNPSVASHTIAVGRSLLGDYYTDNCQIFGTLLKK